MPIFRDTPGWGAPRARRRQLFIVSLVALVIGAMSFFAVPAFAEGESGPTSAETTETTAPPEVTPPLETPPAEEAPAEEPPPVEEPPAEEILAEDPPAEDPPAEEPPVVLQQSQINALGDVTVQGSESDGRAQYNSGNADNCGQAGITASYMLYGAGDSSNSDANLSGVVSAYTGQSPPGTEPYADDADMLNVTVLNADVVIKGIVVKGGNGWNLYSSNVANMISPFNNGGKVPNISHWFVCYDLETPETGSLEVEKVVRGTPGEGEGYPFTVHVECTDDDTTVVDEDLIFTDGGDNPQTISDIPAGAECTITEPGDGGADSVVISPNQVTIVADDTVASTVTNTFNEPETGSIAVEKQTEGQVPANATFEVFVDCEGDDHDETLTFTAPHDLGPKSADNIPVDTECTVEETENSGATLVEYALDGGASSMDPPTVTIGESLQLVTVTNFFPSSTATGVITVEKAVEGTPPAGASYEVHVTCTDGTDETLTFGAEGGTDEITGIQIPEGGTECTVEETGDGGAAQVSYSPADPTFTLTLEEPIGDVLITNAFDDPQVLGTTATRGQAPEGVIETVGGTATGTLPFTGSTTAGLLKAAVWLLVIGSGALLVAGWRRKRAIEA
jgi:hypothetical protein